LIKARGWFLLMGFFLIAGFEKAQAGNEVITIPIIAADYYAWSYTEIFEDNAEIFGYSTAGVDTLGWGWMAFSPDYTGLFLINAAGIAKTVYPAVVLLSSSDSPSRDRAWVALGTHALTLLSLEALGQPELGVQAMGPRGDGAGVKLAFRF
jgi:hypothetical protein